MHKAKVNTINSDVTSSGPNNLVLPAEYAGCIETPFGAQYVNHGEALDHAHMRSGQLSSLLLLMHGEGQDYCRILGKAAQGSLLRLSIQLAEEVQGALDIVASEQSGGAK